MTTSRLLISLSLVLAATAHADERDEPKPAQRAPRRWSLALGPSVWAASVDTRIELGPVEIHRNTPFAQIMQYMDGGMSGSLEAHYDRFTASGGFQFGKLSASKSGDVGGGMAEATGSLETLLVEAALGYRILGGDDARVSFELRSGVRHTELAIDAMGTLGIGGTTISARGGFHQAGTDYLLGARGRLRLHRRATVVATGDTRIAGDSYSTWSIAGDLHVRAARWLTVSAGWRVLERQSNPIRIRRSGPQLLLLFGW